MSSDSSARSASSIGFDRCPGFAAGILFGDDVAGQGFRDGIGEGPVSLQFSWIVGHVLDGEGNPEIGFGIVLRDTLAIAIGVADLDLRVGIAPIRRFAVMRQSLALVLIHAPSGGIGVADRYLGIYIAVFG